MVNKTQCRLFGYTKVSEFIHNNFGIYIRTKYTVQKYDII